MRALLRFGGASHPKVNTALDTSGGKGQKMSDLGHGNITKPDKVDELIDFLTPILHEILARLEGDSFSTVEFIDLLQTDPEANAAYLESLRLWGEGEEYSKMVVHGQVIPAVLRRSPLVEWAGYAHGVHDPYAVPAWWRLK